MSRPKRDLLDWVFEPEADETDERCDSVFRDRFQCVAPLDHDGPHWCPDGALPWMWHNTKPIVYKVP